MCWSFRMGTKKNDKHQLFTRTCKNQTISWLVHNLSIFGARTSHRQTWIHKTYHGPNLGEATTFPLIVYYVLDHRTSTQMSFLSHDSQVGVLKFLKLGLSQLWGLITLCVDLRLRWGLKQNCSSCQKLSNGMWHVTCT